MGVKLMRDLSGSENDVDIMCVCAMHSDGPVAGCNGSELPGTMRSEGELGRWPSDGVNVTAVWCEDDMYVRPGDGCGWFMMYSDHPRRGDPRGAHRGVAPSRRS